LRKQRGKFEKQNLKHMTITKVEGFKEEEFKEKVKL
jgi:hypothetical protein